jgi:hypothetical protein
MTPAGGSTRRTGRVDQGVKAQRSDASGIFAHGVRGRSAGVGDGDMAVEGAR